MPMFEEDDDLLREYARYVSSTHGIPEDFDTWVHSEYGDSRKRARSIRKNNTKGYDY